MNSQLQPGKITVKQDIFRLSPTTPDAFVGNRPAVVIAPVKTRPRVFNDRSAPFLIICSLIIGVQVLVSFTGTTYFLTQLTMSAYYTLVLVGLCLLMGYAGQISLGHAGFFAIGAYSTAFLSTINLQPHTARTWVRLLESMHLTQRGTDPYGTMLLNVSPWLSLAIALIAAGTIAIMIGIPELRLKGHYLAMATLGFGTIIYRLVLGTNAFGAADGISEVQPFVLFAGTGIETGTTAAR